MDMSNARFDGDRPASEGYDWRLTTDNRFEQVRWLRELATDLTLYGNDEGTAEERVRHAFEGEDAVEAPQWFDAHDRRLLVRMVERRIT